VTWLCRIVVCAFFFCLREMLFLEVISCYVCFFRLLWYFGFRACLDILLLLIFFFVLEIGEVMLFFFLNRFGGVCCL
jgi:hypothetical protein